MIVTDDFMMYEANNLLNVPAFPFLHFNHSGICFAMYFGYNSYMCINYFSFHNPTAGMDCTV